MNEPKKISVALTDHEIAIVREEEAITGINSFSATLRKIIREWARNKPPMTTTPDETPESK